MPTDAEEAEKKTNSFMLGWLLSTRTPMGHFLTHLALVIFPLSALYRSEESSLNITILLLHPTNFMIINYREKTVDLNWKVKSTKGKSKGRQSQQKQRVKRDLTGEFALARSRSLDFPMWKKHSIMQETLIQ